MAVSRSVRGQPDEHSWILHANFAIKTQGLDTKLFLFQTETFTDRKRVWNIIKSACIFSGDCKLYILLETIAGEEPFAKSVTNM